MTHDLNRSLSWAPSLRYKATRRQFLAGAVAVAALGGNAAPLVAAPSGGSLKAMAASKGITYGCMVSGAMLRSSPDFCAAVAREAAMIVPGDEMKWGPTQPRRGPSNYQEPDTTWRFASEHGLAMRGHTAVWHRNLPGWAVQDLAAPGGKDLLRAHVHELISHFRGRVVEWDVVNEAIEPRDGLDGDLRNSLLYRAGGKSYIADCFHAAHEADPAARLFYNEYDLVYRTDGEDRRRSSTLRLLSDLKRQGAPVHALGIQCHLKVGNRFEDGVFRRFLADVAALGLRISITEFDIDDQRLPADIAERDRQVADHARRFLDVALKERALTGFLTWGLSDRFTWLNVERPRADGLKKRPLPLDENLVRKPLWQAIARAFDKAPRRG